jgi:hypothetical protein
VNFAAVRAIALALPEVQEGNSFGTSAFKLRKKLRARLREGVLVVRIALADKELLIGAKPEVYLTTPHYEGYPAALVKLNAATTQELIQLLPASWRFVAPPLLLVSVDRSPPQRPTCAAIGDDFPVVGTR